MLSAVNPGRGRAIAEHLVVELKAPHVEIGSAEISQIQDYASALLDDPRFGGLETTWEFWLIGNQIEPGSRRRLDQKDRPPGLVDFGDNYRIWVFQWSQLIDDCKRRLRFLEDLLQLHTSDEEALVDLREAHARRIPESMRVDVDDATTSET